MSKRFLKKLPKRTVQEKAVKLKIIQILEDPFRFKKLRKSMQSKRRVHAFGHFVLVYSINEKEKIVVIEDYDYNDNIYKKLFIRNNWFFSWLNDFCFFF